MPTDRTLDLSVYVVGQQFMNGAFEAQVTYIETASNPSSPGLVNFRNGNIDLTNLGRDPNFSQNVDITFTLVPFMFDKSGNPVQAVWATPITKAIAITGPNLGEMTPSYVNPTKILLDDNDNDSNQYQYSTGRSTTSWWAGSAWW